MIYTRLKEIRQSKGIALDCVALHLQISASAYQAIENGEKDVKISTLLKIVAILNCDMEELFSVDKNFHDNSYCLFSLQLGHQIGYNSLSDKYSERYPLKLKEENEN